MHKQLIRVRAQEIYAPECLGPGEMLVLGDRIIALQANVTPLVEAMGAGNIQDISVHRVIPGLIDQHLHLLGGGDGDGPLARMRELGAEEILLSGITTAATLLGSEMRFKTLRALLYKAEGEAHKGLSTFVYTGSMGADPVSILEDAFSDIALFGRIIGAKAAIADPLYNTHPDRLTALAIQLRQARAQTGKPCILHVHVGRAQQGLEFLVRLCEQTGLPPEQVVPTHVNRAAAVTPVFRQGIEWAKQGGMIDFTCCLGPLDGIRSGMDTVEAVLQALDAGVPPSQMTLTSDAGVAVPDPELGSRQVPPSILMRDLIRLVQSGLPWDVALAFVTVNPAQRLGLSKRKGRLAVGYDADFVCLTETSDIAAVYASGVFHNRHIKTRRDRND